MRKLLTAASLIGLIVVSLASMAMAETGWGAGEVATAGNDQVMAAAEMQAMGGSMPAGEDLCCWLKMPCSCEITCVNLSINCCGCDCEEGSNDPIIVEFWSSEGALLGSASLGGQWCGPCGSESFTGSLDKAVNPQDVCKVTFRSPGDHKLQLNWLKLKVGTDSSCCKMKWWTVLKCKFCCTELGGDKALIASSGW